METIYVPAKLMLKSTVKQHTRRTQSGGMTTVREHSTSRKSTSKFLGGDKVTVNSDGDDNHGKEGRIYTVGHGDRAGTQTVRFADGSVGSYNDDELKAIPRVLSHNNKRIIMAAARRVAEKNLTSGNWTQETAQLFLKGADEQPEKYKKYVKANKSMEANMDLSNYPAMQKAMGTKTLSKSLEFHKSGKEIIEAIHVKIGQCQMEMISVEADLKVEAAEKVAKDAKYTDKGAMSDMGATPEAPAMPEVPWKIKELMRKIERLRRIARNIKPGTSYKLSEHDLSKYGF